MKEVPIYAALKSINIEDDQAERVVQALDEAIDSKVNVGIQIIRGDIAVLRNEFRGELARIDAEIAKVDSKVEHKIDSIRWLIGTLVPVCAVLVTAVLSFITHH